MQFHLSDKHVVNHRPVKQQKYKQCNNGLLFVIAYVE